MGEPRAPIGVQWAATIGVVIATDEKLAMKIGVLGAGRMAEALVPLWIAAGHDVMIAGRTPSKAALLAAHVGARIGTPCETAMFGEVVLLAVLYPGWSSTSLQ